MVSWAATAAGSLPNLRHGKDLAFRRMNETYLFLLLLLSTPKIDEHYLSNKHKKTLEGGEKEAD